MRSYNLIYCTLYGDKRKLIDNRVIASNFSNASHQSQIISFLYFVVQRITTTYKDVYTRCDNSVVDAMITQMISSYRNLQLRNAFHKSVSDTTEIEQKKKKNKILKTRHCWLHRTKCIKSNELFNSRQHFCISYSPSFLFLFVFC